MKISTRGRYAVRTLIDIAKIRKDKDFISVHEIAERQNISEKYLEIIIAKLVKGHLLKSQRGSFGGYKLSKEPTQITLKEILSITGDIPKLATCLEKDCPRLDSCESMAVWKALSDTINNFLENVTLQNIIDNKITH